MATDLERPEADGPVRGRTVARAAKVDHVFEMTNPFEETIHIAAVRASCGCSTPTIMKDNLATWEKGGIHVR